MGLILFIEGNMASGKSTYAEHLSKVIQCDVHSMDRYRMQAWQDGVYASNLREIKAKAAMLQAVRSLDGICIIECIGTGAFDGQIRELASELGYRCFRVLINLPPKECIIRHMVRTPPPYPLAKWMSDPEDYIYTTHRKIGDRVTSCTYHCHINNRPGSTADNLRAILKRFIEWRDKPP